MKTQFSPRIVAPITPLRSPDITAPIGSSCTGPKKGDTPFFSKRKGNYGSSGSFLDVDNNGVRQTRVNNPDSRRIKELKTQFLEKGRIINIDNAGLNKKPEKFEVNIEKGKIKSIRQVVKADGSRITAKTGGKYISKDKLCDYSLSVLGLAGVPDGIYEV